MTKEAMQALDEINDRLRTDVVDNDHPLTDHRIDQRTDFKKLRIKVVFNEKTSLKLLSMLTKVLDTDYVEYGTYFYGNMSDDIILIDDYLSDFALSDGLYENGAVDVTEKNLKELNMKTEKSLNPKTCNVVMHFHTHPDTVKDKNGEDFHPASLLMSEQDLYNYGFHQKYLQPSSKNLVFFLGGMISKNNNRPQFNIVMYDPLKECFYNISNIYITYGQAIFRVDNENFNNGEAAPIHEQESIKQKILELTRNK